MYGIINRHVKGIKHGKTQDFNFIKLQESSRALYGSESWATNKRMDSRSNTSGAEVRFPGAVR